MLKKDFTTLAVGKKEKSNITMKKFSFLIAFTCLLFACSNDDDSYIEIEDVVPNIIPEFRTNLSELNLFKGDLKDLIPSSKTFEYELNSSLFSDYALKQFFKSAKKQDWYNNTLFVFTSDHTSSEPTAEKFKTNIGKFNIPIFFFDPSK